MHGRAGRLLRAAVARPTVLRALRVTGVVAPVLIVINHAACALDGRLGLRCALQSLLTAVVPYLVSTYSSASATIDRK